MTDTNARFVISNAPDEYFDDYVEHIADTEAETEYDRMGAPLLDPDRKLRFVRSEQQLCSRGTWHGDGGLSLEEAADKLDLNKSEFAGDAPDEICTYCWNKVQTVLEDAETPPPDVDYSTVGFRLRWKQKGRARDEWYDILVRPSTTIDELDTLVSRFTTVFWDHLRVYGLEGEYLDSSIQAMPDTQYNRLNHSSREYTAGSSVTIQDVAANAHLQNGDRLTMASDFATPSHYYCIVKDVYDLETLESEFPAEPLSETETAAVVKQRRPDTGLVAAGDNTADTEGETTDSGDGEDSLTLREELELDFDEAIDTVSAKPVFKYETGVGYESLAGAHHTRFCAFPWQDRLNQYFARDSGQNRHHQYHRLCLSARYSDSTHSLHRST